METLNHILIPAVFRTQADLARAVQLIDDSQYKSERALASFLSQIVMGARKCPPKLAKLIVEATRAQSGITEETIANLKKALGQADDDKIFELLNRQLSAKEVVIVRREPLDLRNHPRLDDFQNCMWDALVGPDGQKVEVPTSKYRFIMDSKIVAKEHWQNLTQGLSDYLDRNACSLPNGGAEETLRKLNAAGVGALQISIATADRCVIPLAAFDPERMRGQWIDVFFWESFVVRGELKDQIVAFESELKRDWLEHSYLPHLKEEALERFPYQT